MNFLTALMFCVMLFALDPFCRDCIEVGCVGKLASVAVVAYHKGRNTEMHHVIIELFVFFNSLEFVEC